MLLNVALRRALPAFGLLLWCALGAALVQIVLVRLAPGNPPGNPHGFSPIFWYLLSAYDTHGNFLLVALVLCAYFLRRRSGALAAVRLAADHPWKISAAALLLFCLGALYVYHDYPLSMDEYAAVFQARIFAAGRLAGQFPPDLLESLLPRLPPNQFLTASRLTGEVSGTYWPGFALLMTPFVWIGIPWAANPVISALSLPVVHRLAGEISGSREAAGWAVLLTAASPVFVVSAISYYSMPAHLLCNALYALLLLRPTAARALAAGFVGSIALTLHNPVPHLLFCAAFLAWLVLRRERFTIFAALLAGYLPLVLLIGFGWQQHLAVLAAASAPASTPVPAAPMAATLLERMWAQITTLLTMPRPMIIEARVAGLSKVWTWGAAGLMVLAAAGGAAARAKPAAAVLATALAITFFGYFFVPVDQGHGWGYRYLHSAWFVLPVLASLALGETSDGNGKELRGMAAWAILLSLLLANTLRLVQVDSFIARHLAQVPPLARPVDPARAEIVFVDPAGGFYARDMVHNDPFLRDARITMVYDGHDRTADLMARRFPDYTRREDGKWGELWSAARGRR